MSEEQIVSDIFEDFEFNPQLDVYWDALEVTEESILTILPPTQNVDPIFPAPPERTDSYSR